MTLKFTIFGSTGFIGSHLVRFLHSKNFECFTPNIRNYDVAESDNLGHIIYAIGVSDFLNYPHKAIDAHVCYLNKILESRNFESLLYISSGRIYYNSSLTSEENTVKINPTSKNDLYNISKLMGESLCLASNKHNVKIIRPSNVIGTNAPSNLFIPSIIIDAIQKKKITLHSTLESKKDYIYIDDLVKLTLQIILDGKYSIYNIASGYNTKSRDIINEIVKLTNCTVEITSDAKEFSSPQICVDRIKSEFNFTSIPIINKIQELVDFYKNST